MLRFALLLALLATALPVASAQVATLPPVDEAASDPSFLTFRSRLLGSIAARDTAAVFAAFSPTATVSFGAENTGPEGLREVWFGDDRPAGGEFWSTLAETVSLGSAVDDTFVAAPYIFLRFPAALDAFSHVAVVGESVRIRDAPTLTGQVLGSVTYAVLPLDPSPTETVDDWSRWTPILLATGEKGWISSQYVRSPIGFRAGFEKTPAGWRITFFVAGD